MEPYYQSAFPPEEFALRRRSIMDRIGPASVAVIGGAGGTGAFDRFRQTNEFFYLSGVEVPHAYLLIDARSESSTLYLPPHDAKHAKSEGAQLSCDDDATACRLTGIERVRPLAQLADDVEQAQEIFLPTAPGEGREACRDTLLYQRKVAASDPWAPQATREEYLRDCIATRWPNARLRDLSPLLDELRLHKSERELAMIQRAGELTATAVQRAIAATRAGMFEYQLAAIADGVFADAGAQGPGYRPIVASGRNIWNAHYFRNHAKLASGDLVLMDYAPDWHYYTSDIGRMWPVSGRYSPAQRELYGFVVAYQEVLLQILRPGVTVAELVREGAEIMQPLWEGYAFSQANYRAAAWQMIQSPVAFTHPVGMAVHDVGEYRAQPLRRGLVFALDPQLWVPEESLYYRVEDTVVITATGVQSLTDGAARHPDAIEALMAASR